MNHHLTPKQLKRLFMAVEVNFVLWIGIAYSVYQPGPSTNGHYIATLGCIFAIGVQHWGYYNLYKRAKDEEKLLKSSMESHPIAPE
jgi:hypothetical protein